MLEKRLHKWTEKGLKQHFQMFRALQYPYTYCTYRICSISIFIFIRFQNECCARNINDVEYSDDKYI